MTTKYSDEKTGIGGKDTRKFRARLDYSVSTSNTSVTVTWTAYGQMYNAYKQGLKIACDGKSSTGACKTDDNYPGNNTWYNVCSVNGTTTYSRGTSDSTKTLTATATAQPVDDYGGNYGSISVSSDSISVPALPIRTITYKPNGASAEDKTQKVYHGAEATILSSNTFSRTGYVLGGWNTQSNGSGTPYTAGGKGSFTSDTTLYAQWIPNKLYVQYNANGGEISSDSTYYLSDDLIYNKSTSNIAKETWIYNETHQDGLTNASTFKIGKIGYTFQGWKVGSDGAAIFRDDDLSIVPTDLSTSIETNTESTITMYAVWNANEYIIEYNANDNTGATYQQTHTYDVEQNLTSNTFVRAGYTFTGWNTEQDGAGDSYSDGQSVMNLSSTSGDVITLYAQWREHVLVVNYKSNYATYALVDGVENTEVSADQKDIVVRTSEYKYATPIPNGLHKYSSEGDDTYMKRTRYDATGYWGIKSGSEEELEEGFVSIHENATFESGAKLAEALGDDVLSALEAEDVEIDLYALWVLLASRITVFDENGNAQKGLVHIYTDNMNFITVDGDEFKDANEDYFITGSGLRYGIITIFDSNGIARMAI